MPILRPPSLIPLRTPRCPEEERINDAARGTVQWKGWGTYVSERSWGSVREDYGVNGDAWNFLPHDMARSVAYRWGEDGLAGWCDAQQNLCFAPAFWNGNDPILKERAFGLTNSEGNHGEDVKEYYYYLDNTPTHSYAKYLYKYPQAAYPYAELVSVNNERRAQPASFEYELLDTGVFEQGYFDIFIEYAKASPETTVIRIEAFNRGRKDAPLHLLPTVWFRDTWSYAGIQSLPMPSKETRRYARSERARVCERPDIGVQSRDDRGVVLTMNHAKLGEWFLHAPPPRELLFTENATNFQRLNGSPNPSVYCKDAFHERLVHGRAGAVNPQLTGTKAAPLYIESIPAQGSRAWMFVLTHAQLPEGFSGDAVIGQRKRECDEFYSLIQPPNASAEEKKIQRHALSGMLWNKQFYYLDVQQWMDGDVTPDCAVQQNGAKPPFIKPCRKPGRNHGWRDLNAEFVMSMPDKWEYPWFAAWDLSFQCVTIALIDPDLAKEQMLLLVSEALQHPNGQLPAYEWEFSDVNPPVQAWAAYKIYQSGRRHYGIKDRDFLERIFQKLMLNFAWWVNRADTNGDNIFEGGFLGLDNISVFDRSEPLPGGGQIEQSDGTAWMGLFSLSMMRIAFELALDDPVYEDMATKFFEHFMALADAINHDSGSCTQDPEAALGLWDERDGFYYDQVRFPSGGSCTVRVRSLVGLLPMVASEILHQEDLDRLPMFKARYEWFTANRPSLAKSILTAHDRGGRRRHLLSIVGEKRLRRILRRLLDENEFLSPYGLRSLSKVHEKEPFVLHVDGIERTVRYEPAEALTRLKGGNSNWRGPIWFPTTCLLLDVLTVFDAFIGDAIRFPFPSNNGEPWSCAQIAMELGQRMIGIFLPDPITGRRPCFGGNEVMQNDPHWKDYILFYEYFHGDNGAGLGAMHQTGWTGFVANVIERKYREINKK